jgi:hypothetical protein
MPEAPGTRTSFLSFIAPKTTNYLIPEQGSMSVPQQASIYLDPGDSATTAPDSAPTDGGGLANDGNNSAQLAGDYLSTGDGTTKTPEAGRVGRPTEPSFAVPSTTFSVLRETDSATGNPPPGSPTLSPILVVDSSGQTLAFTPTTRPGGTTGASVVLALGKGKTLIESVIGGKTITKVDAPVLTVVNGQTYSALQTAILTVINGQTFTEVAVAVPTTPDTISLQYVNHSPNFERLHSNPSRRKTGTAILPIATIVNLTGTFLDWNNGESTFAPEITLKQYVLVSFVPLILATFYIIPWKILDNTIREMEPFYQLSQPGGATAENSLCLDYATSFLFTTPFKSIRNGHAIVLWSSLTSLAVIFLPSLVSEALFVSTTGICTPDVRDRNCHSVWAVYPKLIRAIQALLSFIAVLLILMIIYGYRRNSGVYSEPLSIAGLASLLSNSSVLETFQMIDSTTKKRELQRLLAGKRFAISEFSALGKRECYGVTELEPETPAAITRKWLPRKKGRFKRMNNPDRKSPSDLDRTAEEDVMKPRLRISRVWCDIRLKLYYYLAILFLGGLFILIAFYFFTRGDSGFELWMDSGTYGLRFAWTGLGTAIKLFFNYLDQGKSISSSFFLSTNIPQICAATSHIIASFSDPRSRKIPSSSPSTCHPFPPSSLLSAAAISWSR